MLIENVEFNHFWENICLHKVVQQSNHIHGSGWGANHFDTYTGFNIFDTQFTLLEKIEYVKVWIADRADKK